MRVKRYVVGGMGPVAWHLMRDRSDLAWAVAHGLPSWIVASYEEALRDLAADLIGAGL